MINPKVKFSYRDYLETPDDQRWELIDGELYITPAPNDRHQEIVANLLVILHRYVRRNRLGQVRPAPRDVLLAEDSVVQPDLLFISRGRISISGMQFVEDAPDLVVEVLSPGTESRDRNLKATLYARHGVNEFWIVDPESESVEVRRLTDDGYLPAEVHRSGEISTSQIPGLVVRLGEVFSTD